MIHCFISDRDSHFSSYLSFALEEWLFARLLETGGSHIPPSPTMQCNSNWPFYSSKRVYRWLLSQYNQDLALSSPHLILSMISGLAEPQRWGSAVAVLPCQWDSQFTDGTIWVFHSMAFSSKMVTFPLKRLQNAILFYFFFSKKGSGHLVCPTSR